MNPIGMSLRGNLKIVFLTPYPHDTAPGQRFRFEQYYDILQGHGYQLTLLSFFSEGGYAKLQGRGTRLLVPLFIFWGFARRLFHLSMVVRTDFVFLFREAAPVGPPIIEWIVSKVLKKKIIYDFDDAIWLTDRTDESKLEKLIRWRSKVGQICKWSYRVSCGNAYLAAYSKQFNLNVIVNPTTIDTKSKHNQTKKLLISPSSNSSVTIGWTGSHSTLKYLTEIESTLRQLETKFDHVRFIFIADRRPQLNLTRFVFIDWNKESEIEDLLKIDIGIMPLPDDEWTKGKCGFKVLQYMSLGIPAAASPVGVNSEIIDHGVNGFLCLTHEDWVECLEKLITNLTLRKQMGVEGRKKIISNYSVVSNSSLFLGLFS